MRLGNSRATDISASAIGSGLVSGSSTDYCHRIQPTLAIGDSRTEGLWDGDESTRLLGFADRLGVMLDSLYPGSQYANLAIRGKRLGDVLTEQIPETLAMDRI